MDRKEFKPLPMNCTSDRTSVCLEMVCGNVGVFDPGGLFQPDTRIRVPVIPSGNLGIDGFMEDWPQAFPAPYRSLPTNHEPTIQLTWQQWKTTKQGKRPHGEPVEQLL
jgi:hypothetical protein